MMGYDLTQTIFLLSLASNRASVVTMAPGQTPKPANPPDLQQFLSLSLNNPTKQTLDIYVKNVEVKNAPVTGFFDRVGDDLLGGDWSVVWGPQVFSNPDNNHDHVADNALFVANSPSQGLYVVAIAATNAASQFDWVQEDFAVQKMVNFPFDPHKPLKIVMPNPEQVQITHGTALGVSILLSQMPDPTTGKSLSEFLTNVADRADSSVIFTGHSLAGALSPTTALLLQPALAKAGWKNVYVLPTAGATPGNALFNTKFTDTFPATDATDIGTGAPLNSGNNVTQLNRLYWNNADVVPRAWTQLTAYLTVKKHFLYSTYNILPGDTKVEALFAKGLSAALNTAQGWGTTSNLQQLTNNAPFNATFPVTYWDSKETAYATYNPPNEIYTLPQLGGLIAQAHIGQYSQAFNLNAQAYPPPLESTPTPDEYARIIAFLERLFHLGVASTTDGVEPTF